jgi:photosystem II stability/assembly factor-like uncharacterized protein
VTRLFAAAGDGVFRIEPGNGEWTAARVLQRDGAQCLAASDSSRLFAGCRGSGLLASEDGGETWDDAGFPEPDVFSVAVSRADGTVYAGCEPSALYRRDGSGWEELATLKEIPSAPTWSFPPRPWTSHVRWIAPSPHDAKLLLVGIELGGLMRTEDGGETWADHAQGAQPDVHAIAWHPRARGRAYEAGGGGAAWSADGGVTWRAADDGRDRHYTWALAVDPDDADCWYVSANPGPMLAHRPGNAQAHVYRRRGDEPWERLAGGLPDPLEAMPYALLVADGSIYAGLSDGRLFMSADGGDSWEQIPPRGEPPRRILALVAV